MNLICQPSLLPHHHNQANKLIELAQAKDLNGNLQRAKSTQEEEEGGGGEGMK